jgi:putative ABC transport system permease protein
VARARALDGVAGAALLSGWPYGGREMAASRPGMQAPGGARGVLALFCDEHYLGLVGLHALRGRAFAPADMTSGARVAIISRALADRYFGQEDPIGQYLDLPDLAKAPASVTDPRFSIVGVVEDVRNQGPNQIPRPGIYLPTTVTMDGNTPRLVLVRTTGDAATVVPALERTVRAVDANVPVRSGQTVEGQLQRGLLAQPRFSLVILTVFAIIGLLLVAVGIYGVMAYAVSQRRHEFAIRMALGATGEDVVRSVVRSGTVLLGAGVGIGLAASRVTNGLVSTVVFDARGDDSMLSAAIVVAVIAAVGLTACLVPARRASRTSPIAALRQD